LKKISAVLICVLFLSNVCFASESLSWDAAVNLAKAQNPSLISAEQTVNKASLEYNKTYSSFLPSLSASASTSKSQPDDSPVSDSYSWGLSGQLSLFNGFGDLAQLRIGKMNLLLAQQNQKRSVSDVLYSLREAFVNLLAASENNKLAQSIKERRDKNYEIVKIKYSAGTEDKGSLLRVEADKLKSQIDAAQALRQINVVTAKLYAVLGMPAEKFDSMVDVQGEFLLNTDIKLQDNLLDLAHQTPEYINAQFEYKKTKEQEVYYKSKFLPKLTLQSGYSKSDSIWPPENGRLNSSLNISYEFFNGGSSINDIYIVAKDIKIAQENLRKVEQEKLTSLLSAKETYQAAQEELLVRQKYLEASQEQSKIITAKYVNGLATYQDWYTVENDFISAQKALLSSKTQAAIAQGRWINILGE